MKKLITTFLAIGMISAGISAQTITQDQDKAKLEKDSKKVNRETAAASSLYIISAKAGAVNFVSGKVAVERGNSKSGYLVKGDSLQNGEKLNTGSDGKAEILLNPGSFVRLAENTNFNFDSTELDNLQVSLNSGSAIFEVIADDDFIVTVKTPKSKYDLIKSGIYRIDALSDGTGKISVWKGKAAYGNAKNETVKGGQTTAIVNGQLTVQKFDRDNKGEFEAWSKDRSKELAKINDRLQNRTMNLSLLSAFNRDPSGWGNSSGYGYWVLDPLSRSYCFLPFQTGYRSPYGFGFNRFMWGYQAPWYIYQRNPNIYNQNPSNVNNGAGNPNPNPNNGNNQNVGGGNRPNRPERPNVGDRPDRPNRGEGRPWGGRNRPDGEGRPNWGGNRPNRGEGRPNWGGNRPPREGMNRPPIGMGDSPSMNRPPMSNPSISNPPMSRPPMNASPVGPVRNETLNPSDGRVRQIERPIDQK